MARDVNFYPLRIASKLRETDDTVTLYFDVPEELKPNFEYKAGQYLTLRFSLGGEEERRSYSMSTKPGEGMIGVTVKRVKDGRVSKHIHDHIKEGESVEVMPPDGRFVVEPDPEARKIYYFFGAGSGITPLMSQISTLLEEEPMSSLHLFYGSRTPDSIIFKDRLDNLAEKHAGQFTVDHLISQPGKPGMLGSIFGKKSHTEWAGMTGRITGDRIPEFLEMYPRSDEQAEYLICGPGDMIDNIKAALEKLGVTPDHIHTEYFTTGESVATGPASGGGTSTARVTLRGEVVEVPVTDEPILFALQDAGYDPPYSCTSGACASCMAKVTKGSATMDMCFALDDSEVEEGYILTCQAHPTTAEIELTYDV